jgi:hypothetical protein
MSPTNTLLSLLERHIAGVKKPASEATFGEAYARLGIQCPEELASLPSTAALGFFPEVDMATWQVLTPDEVVHVAVPKPADRSLGVPVVHCYDNTYIVVAPDGRAYMWDAVGEVAFESWPSLAAALQFHLEP